MIARMDDACVKKTGFGALLTPEEEDKKNEFIVKLSKINIKNFNVDNEINDNEHDEGSKVDTIAKKEAHIKDNDDWSPSAINSLLNAWRDQNKNAIECRKVNMDCSWKEISKEVNGQSGNSKKTKDCDQCKLKFKAMQGRYNREKMAKKFNLNESNSWEWYASMNTLFNEIPCSTNNSMDVKSIKEGIDVSNNAPSLITCYDVNNKHVEKRDVEENVSTRLISIDVRGKNLHTINNEGTFSTKNHEDKNMLQYNNLLSPTSPHSPRSFTKVKWRDASSPQLNLIDKLKEETTFQDSMLNSNPSCYEDKQTKVLLVNEIKEKLKCGEQNTTNHNGPVFNRKDKSTLKAFDLCSNTSMSYNASDVMDQDSATSSPIGHMASQTKCKENKGNEINSFVHKDCEDQHMSRFSVMELSRSINCNYKRMCVESVTNNKCNYENKEISKEKISMVGEEKSHIFENSNRQSENLATNIRRGNEQMAISITQADSKVHSAQLLSAKNSMASITSQSESSYSSKQKRRLCILSKYKYEQENQFTRTFISALKHATNIVPRIKKKNKSLARAFHAHEPNMVIALMTLGAMIQQLEKNQITMMERFLNEQAIVLDNFVKTLKHNDQVREAAVVGLIMRILLSLFLIGIILYGTSKTSSNWMPINFQSNSWYGKSNDDYSSQLAWIGCFIIVVLTQLLWTSFKRRHTTPLH